MCVNCGREWFHISLATGEVMGPERPFQLANRSPFMIKLRKENINQPKVNNLFTSSVC